MQLRHVYLFLCSVDQSRSDAQAGLRHPAPGAAEMRSQAGQLHIHGYLVVHHATQDDGYSFINGDDMDLAEFHRLIGSLALMHNRLRYYPAVSDWTPRIAKLGSPYSLQVLLFFDSCPPSAVHLSPLHSTSTANSPAIPSHLLADNVDPFLLLFLSSETRREGHRRPCREGLSSSAGFYRASENLSTPPLQIAGVDLGVTALSFDLPLSRCDLTCHLPRKYLSRSQLFCQLSPRTDTVETKVDEGSPLTYINIRHTHTMRSRPRRS